MEPKPKRTHTRATLWDIHQQFPPAQHAAHKNLQNHPGFDRSALPWDDLNYYWDVDGQQHWYLPDNRQVIVVRDVNTEKNMVFMQTLDRTWVTSLFIHKYVHQQTDEHIRFGDWTWMLVDEGFGLSKMTLLIALNETAS